MDIMNYCKSTLTVTLPVSLLAFGADFVKPALSSLGGSSPQAVNRKMSVNIIFFMLIL